MRLALAALFAALLFAAVTPVAGQADDFEPDDTFATAYGPLSGEDVYSAAIDSADDRDDYWFNTTGPGLTTISVEGDESCADGTLAVEGADGTTLASAADLRSASIDHVSPAAQQVVVEVSGSAGCQYDLTVDPPELVTQADPGVVAHLGAIRDADTVQRVLVDGHVAAETTNDRELWAALGVLPPDARITFEAQNAAGSWAWQAQITNQVGRQRTVLIDEREAGGYVGGARNPRLGPPAAPRVGITRHVVVTVAGTVLESCGERDAPATCFPVDEDLDGIADPQDACPLLAGVPSAQGCPDRDGDAVADSRDDCPLEAGPVGTSGCPDADGDRVTDSSDGCPTVAGTWPRGCPAVRRYATYVSLHHRGRRFTGKVLGLGAGCHAHRVVRLRRAGRHRTLARARTTTAGTFTIRSRQRHGPFRVTVAGRTPAPGTRCRKASSKRVR